METDRSLGITMEETLPRWKDYPMSALPDDPRSPEPAVLYVHKVPIGELRPVFRAVGGRSVLSAVAVDEFPMIAWPK